jgi:hypothetical protein
MNIRDLLPVLEQLREAYGANGTKTAEKHIAMVIELLTPHYAGSVEALTAELHAAAVSGESKLAPPPVLADKAVVDEYLERLSEVGTDQRAFDQIFTALNEDPRVKLKEVDAIARQFTGQQSAFKTKKAAQTALKQTFLERVRFENKLRAVS